MTRSSKSGIRSLGGLVFVVTAGRHAYAQAPPNASNEVRAEALFRSGEKKFDSGRHVEACNDFRESLRLGPKLGTLLNLALCHETIGKTATAWSEYHHGAAWAAQNGQKERRDFAMQHAAALETQLPRVLFQLPTTTAIASVEVDGEPLADSRWYLPVFLDPGEHSVTLSAPGKERASVKFRVIRVSSEQLVSIPSLEDEKKAPPPVVVQPVPIPTDPDSARRFVGFVTLGAGGVGLALGMTFGFLAVSKRDEIGARCSGNRCTDVGADLYRDAQSKAAIATWSTALGVGAAAVGGWLVLTSRSASRGPRVGVTPRAGGAEFAVGASF